MCLPGRSAASVLCWQPLSRCCLIFGLYAVRFFEAATREGRDVRVSMCKCVCVCDISAFEVISGMASARQSRHFNQQLLEESSFSVHFIFPISLCHSSVRFVPFRWRWLHLRDNAYTHKHLHTVPHRQTYRQTLELPSFTPALVAAAHHDNVEGDTSIIFCCSNVEISSQRLKCTLVLSLPAVGSTPNSAPCQQ